MNFLGHIVLARDTAESRVGNFLGDFVKGLPSHFPEEYGAELVDGILMHRAVDVFTDRHPAFLKARGLLSPERRRFAGIVVDVFFDHFLSLGWEEHMKVGREDFIGRFYGELEDFRLPFAKEIFPEITERMARQDWLGSYATVEGIALTMRRISTRSSRLGSLIGAAEDLEKESAGFQECFETSFPDVRKFVYEWQCTKPVGESELR